MPRSTITGEGHPNSSENRAHEDGESGAWRNGGPALYPPTITPPERPPRLPGFLRQFVANPLRALPRQVYEDDLTLYQPTKHLTVLWVSAPELIEEVLIGKAALLGKSPLEKRVFAGTLGEGVLTSDGDRWRWQRRVMAPLFRHGEILSYVPVMARAADEQVAQWRQAGSGSRAVDQDMMTATFKVILRTMLAGGNEAEAFAIMRGGSDYLSRVTWEMAHALLRLPKWLPHPATWQMRRAARTVRSALSDIIERRRDAPDGGTDLLGRLIQARDPNSGTPMSHEQLIDNLSTLLEAGHETTAKALTWTLYLLARAPEWQDAVRDEVSRVAGNMSIGTKHIDKFVYTTRVLKESMRLYPPVPVMARQSKEPLELAGVKVPAGAQIVVPIFAVHRHRRLWTDPDRFDPSRFEPEQEAERPRTQFMPFGAGQRICLGQSFALVEAVALLATFVRGARFDWDGRYEPEPVSRITLRPKGGMPLQVTPVG